MNRLLQGARVFEGEGEVRSLLRTHDWSSSPLGHPQSWPQELIAAVNLLLNSKFPMFIAWGSELGFLYNDEYARILGDKHPHALGRRFRDIWSEIWTDISPIIENALARKASYFEDLPLTILRKGYPEHAWFTFSYSPVEDAEGAVAGMYCTVIETTLQVLAKRRQAFQLELADRLRSLTSPDDIVAMSSAILGRHLDVSRVLYAEVNDAEGTFFIRRDWTSHGLPSIAGIVRRLEDFGPEITAALRAGQAVPIHDVTLDARTAAHADAYALIGVRSNIAIPLVKCGRLLAVLGLHHAESHRWTDSDIQLAQDMAERTWSAVESARAQAELREASRRKDEFLAMLAHELRNPLAPISAAAELMAMTQLDEARLKQTSQVISRQVSHMTALVDDLLDVSRVTRGLVTINKSPQDVIGIVSHALEQVRPIIEARRHHLVTDIAPEPAHVLGDQKRLIQILTNLLNNAAKYTPEGGAIHLRMAVRGAQIELSVRDNGIGIAPELQPRVFDLFAQAERTADRSQGGLGLGLALVKSLVELHGGTVRCFSQGLGKGSVFTVCLPRAMDGDMLPDCRQSNRDVLPAKNKLRVFIVDDNADAARMLALLLEASGHHVTVEHESHRALEHARLAPPDVCVLDIGLPDMDGYELARCLRVQPETAKAILIAVTGYGHAQDRNSALAAGFDHHLVKPVDASRLIALLADIGQAS
jgi:signal transduction histidine kinase/ActR/RegA family two-component response regulator